MQSVDLAHLQSFIEIVECQEFLDAAAQLLGGFQGYGTLHCSLRSAVRSTERIQNVQALKNSSNH